MNKLFSRIYTFFHTREFLGDMLIRYSAQNRAVEDENSRLRKKLGQKDKVLQRALDDHAQTIKFHQSVITGMQKRIKDLEEFNGPRDLNPETEADYIDQVIQEQADRAPNNTTETGYNPF